MAYIKTNEEMQEILAGGRILGEILEELAEMAAPGMTTKEIDARAEQLIRKAGGIPAFKGYQIPGHPSFPATICASVNEEIVHGIPGDRELKDGDILSIDIGMRYRQTRSKHQKAGFFTDTALTVPIGKINAATKQLVAVTKKALDIGIQSVRIGGTIADIGRAVQTYIDKQGYGIVRDLVGHGVGHAVHEDPPVPNYYDRALEGWNIEPGVVIAIEPMITMGDYRTAVADDQWTVSTADKSLSAHFEHTIVVTEDGVVVATKRPSE